MKRILTTLILTMYQRRAKSRPTRLEPLERIIRAVHASLHHPSSDSRKKPTSQRFVCSLGRPENEAIGYRDPTLLPVRRMEQRFDKILLMIGYLANPSYQLRLCEWMLGYNAGEFNQDSHMNITYREHPVEHPGYL